MRWWLAHPGDWKDAPKDPMLVPKGFPMFMARTSLWFFLGSFFMLAADPLIVKETSWSCRCPFPDIRNALGGGGGVRTGACTQPEESWGIRTAIGGGRDTPKKHCLTAVSWCRAGTQHGTGNSYQETCQVLFHDHYHQSAFTQIIPVEKQFKLGTPASMANPKRWPYPKCICLPVGDSQKPYHPYPKKKWSVGLTLVPNDTLW